MGGWGGICNPSWTFAISRFFFAIWRVAHFHLVPSCLKSPKFLTPSPSLVSCRSHSSSLPSPSAAPAMGLSSAASSASLLFADNSADESRVAAKRQTRRARALQEYRDLMDKGRTPRTVLGGLLQDNRGRDESGEAVKTVTPSYMAAGGSKRRRMSRLLMQSAGSAQTPTAPSTEKPGGEEEEEQEESVESVPDLGTPVVAPTPLRRPLRRRTGGFNSCGALSAKSPFCYFQERRMFNWPRQLIPRDRRRKGPRGRPSVLPTTRLRTSQSTLH